MFPARYLGGYKKTFTPQNGNEGIHNPARTSGTVWPHPSLCGEVRKFVDCFWLMVD